MNARAIKKRYKNFHILLRTHIADVLLDEWHTDCVIMRCKENHFSHLPLQPPCAFYSSSVMALLRLHQLHCLIHFSFRCHLSHQVADLTDHLTGEPIRRPIGRWMTKNAPNILLVPYVPQTIVPIHQNVAWNGIRQDQKVELLL